MTKATDLTSRIEERIRMTTKRTDNRTNRGSWAERLEQIIDWRAPESAVFLQTNGTGFRVARADAPGMFNVWYVQNNGRGYCPDVEIMTGARAARLVDGLTCRGATVRQRIPLDDLL